WYSRRRPSAQMRCVVAKPGTVERCGPRRSTRAGRRSTKHGVSAMYLQILYEVDDPVATITLNRPEKLNALTTRMRQELDHALADAERRSDVVGIVLTGAGRAFCAGVDMGELQQIQAAGSIGAVRGDSEFSNVRPGDP